MVRTQKVPTAMRSKVTTLIVDDRPQVRRDLRLLLELSGKVEVVGEASNGLEALEQAAIYQPEVVIMDLELPGMDGCQATLQIKQQNPDCRVVFLSIYASPTDIQRARQAGADAYIQKGSPIEDLIQQILAGGRNFQKE